MVGRGRTGGQRSQDEAEGRRPLLTTTEAARVLGMSRQTVVAMCDSGDVSFVQVGTHRRLEPHVVVALRDRARRRPVAARRSLWLAHAAAGQLAQDPERVLHMARQSLAVMQSAGARGRSRGWLKQWDALLDGPIDAILEVLTGSTVEHEELRQHSPLTAALSEEQRKAVLRAFTTHGRDADSW